MRVELNYGRGTLPVELDDGLDVTVVRRPPMPPLPDPAAAVAAALAEPVGAPPLAVAARTARRACILICDITRPVPNGLLLPALVDTLLAAGMAADAVTVLVATGLHRPNEGAELEELVGDPRILRTVRVVNHDARDDAMHADLGATPTRGTPVKLDRRFVEADLRIATGLVEPHFMAGWSGGRKVIAPGVAHRDTIVTFHSHRFMADPLADNCVLAGNPLHEEQLQIVRMVGGALGLNTVIDEARRLAFVNYGEIVAGHLQAAAFARRHARVPVGRRFGTVVTSAAGHPLDRTYYQTVKGMVAPLDILAPGGTLVIASACGEGLGSAAFADAQRRLAEAGPDRFLASLRGKRFADVDEWQTQMQLKPMAAGAIRLVSDGLGAADRALTGVGHAASVEAAVAESVAASGDRSVAVVPEGPYVVPVGAAVA